MAKEYWAKIDPAREINANSRPKKSLAPEQVRRVNIPLVIKRAIWKRDEGSCAFVSRQTGQRCGSRHRIQLDHYPTPYALGGENTEENLRLTCYQHNAFHAIQKFGIRKMQRHWARKKQ
jgi:5-methylcytosine-specific restriction endonuclease McrA